MNKADIISQLARKHGVEKPVVDKIVNGLFDEIISQLQQGQEVTFAGFGSFMAKARHARMGVNPLKPNEKIQMPATVVPKFKAGKTLKDSLKPKNNSTASVADAEKSQA